MERDNLLVTQSNPFAILPPITPSRAYSNDVGLDLYTYDNVWLWPFMTTDLPTGWRVKVPDGSVGLILPRSSTFKRMHMFVHNGVVDPSYTGPLSVLVRSMSLWPRRIKRGTRLAQLVIVPYFRCTPHGVVEMPKTARGSRGFGSTGEGLP